MSLDLANMTTLSQDAEGVWRASASRPVSYPDTRHDTCFAVEANSFWFAHRARCILTLLSRYPPPGALFDIGGGNGFMTAQIAAAGFESVLMEPGELGVRNALQRGVEPIICATLEQAEFPDHSLPAMGLFDVVEHIENDVEFLQTVQRLLTPDGHVYITVPAYEFLWSMSDVEAGHFRRYTLRGLEHRLCEAGLEMLFGTYIFGLLPLFILPVRTIPHRLGWSRARSEEWRQKEHATGPEGGSGLIDLLFRWELRSLRKGRRIPCGGSCLVVARANK